jgi:hypothetical protein
MRIEEADQNVRRTPQKMSGAAGGLSWSAFMEFVLVEIRPVPHHPASIWKS